MKLTALGNTVVVFPCLCHKGKHLWVVSFKRNGRWEAATKVDDVAAANKEVARILRGHKKLAKQWGPKVVEKMARSR